MNYRSTNNRNKPSIVKPLIIAIIIIGFFALLHTIVFKSPNSIIQQAGVPLWKANNASLGVFGNILAYFSFKSTLADENRKLLERTELLRLEVLNTRALEKENEELKKQLGREDSSNSRVLALVLLKPTFSPYDTFVIDVGGNLGIEVDNHVVVAGVPVGKVAEVYANSSLVRLYSSPGQEFQVYIGENNIEALAKGMGGNNFFLVLPRETAIKEGDTVSIPSIQTNTFAIVNKIEMEENESFQKVYFRNPVNMHQTKWVEVEK